MEENDNNCRWSIILGYQPVTYVTTRQCCASCDVTWRDKWNLNLTSQQWSSINSAVLSVCRAQSSWQS